MNITEQQIRDEAERLYPPKKRKGPFTTYQNCRREGFYAACKWLLSQQTKPEKTAEERLGKIQDIINEYRLEGGDPYYIVKAIQEVFDYLPTISPDPSSSLRDALGEMVQRAQRGIRFYEDTPALLKAKAALNNTDQSKKDKI